MATYHASVKIISRGRGQNAVAAAAYRARECLLDDRYGKTHDYSERDDLVHAEILAPADAPAWIHNRQALWNAVEAAEKRKDSQLARELELALPRELDRDQQVALLRSYLRKYCVADGMVADFAIHNPAASDGGEQPHAHVMLTMRHVTSEGFGRKATEWNPAIAKKTGKAFVANKNPILDLRSGWADETNQALRAAGSKARVDHRSLKNTRDATLRLAKAARGTGLVEEANTLESKARLYDRPAQLKQGPRRRAAANNPVTAYNRDVQRFKAALETAYAAVPDVAPGQAGARHSSRDDDEQFLTGRGKSVALTPAAAPAPSGPGLIDLVTAKLSRPSPTPAPSAQDQHVRQAASAASHRSRFLATYAEGFALADTEADRVAQAEAVSAAEKHELLKTFDVTKRAIIALRKQEQELRAAALGLSAAALEAIPLEQVQQRLRSLPDPAQARLSPKDFARLTAFQEGRDFLYKRMIALGAVRQPETTRTAAPASTPQHAKPTLADAAAKKLQQQRAALPLAPAPLAGAFEAGLLLSDPERDRKGHDQLMVAIAKATPADIQKILKATAEAHGRLADKRLQLLSIHLKVPVAELRRWHSTKIVGQQHKLPDPSIVNLSQADRDAMAGLSRAGIALQNRLSQLTHAAAPGAVQRPSIPRPGRSIDD